MKIYDMQATGLIIPCPARRALQRPGNMPGSFENPPGNGR